MEDGRETPSENHSADSKPQTTPLVVVADNSPGDVARARAKHWTARLRKSGANYKRTLENVTTALDYAPEWHKVLSYNESSLVILVARPLPWETSRKKADLPDYPRPWTDQDERLATIWMQQKRIEVPLHIVSQAIQTAAQENKFHPIREYLTGLQWDGAERVAKWLHTYLGAEDSRHHEAVGQRWLISAVARVMQPGVKADCMLILEGEQGTGKSTALCELAGRAWFTDEISDLGSKDASMGIAGKWIIEFGELEAFKGIRLETLKAFLSRSMDHFRPPYGRNMVDSPRQCVFAGTTNDLPLTDETGNRRFWPVETGKIDIGSLKRDRDQLWAEARALYDLGYPWWAETPEIRALIEEATEKHYENDPLESEVIAWVKDRDEIPLIELTLSIFEKEKNALLRQDTVRIGKILRHLGYKRSRLWTGNHRGAIVFIKSQ